MTSRGRAGRLTNATSKRSDLPNMEIRHIGADRPRFFFAADLTGPKTRAIVAATFGISGLVLPAFTSCRHIRSSPFRLVVEFRGNEA